MTAREYFRVHGRYRLLALIVVIPTAAAIIWCALAILRPMPPRVVVMATGPQEGAYEEWGKRLSIGPDGSGTKALMLRILALNGISERDAELLTLTPEEAKEKLLQGEIDAAAMLTSAESPV